MATSTNPAEPITLLKFSQLCVRLCCHRQTVYRRLKEKDSNFPRPVKHGRSVVFIASEVEKYLQELADAREPHATEKKA